MSVCVCVCVSSYKYAHERVLPWTDVGQLNNMTQRTHTHIHIQRQHTHTLRVPTHTHCCSSLPASWRQMNEGRANEASELCKHLRTKVCNDDLPELFEFWQRGRKTHCASGRTRE